MDYILSRPLKKIKKYIFLLPVFFGLNAKAQELKTGTINRKALVSRHNIRITNPQLAGPMQVGNGDFAYGFDITGMQTFNDQFTTMSHWGWHSTEPPKGFTADSFKQTLVNTHGRMVAYDLPDRKQAALTQWLSSNPHRFNLGRIGLLLKKEDGSMAKINDLHNPVQYLDLWTGITVSNFTIEGQNVKVTTVCGPDKDIISFRIESVMIQKGRLGVFIEFPYASLDYFSDGSDYNNLALHQTKLNPINKNSVIFNRKLDSTTYQVACKWTGNGKAKRQKDHRYVFYPGKNETSVEYVFAFSPSKIDYILPAFSLVKVRSMAHWPVFWKSGGAVDLSESKDPRWFELERRIVLSQYIMAINAAGNYPPQETGLVNNSWYGRFHYEMYWWHAAHYALWDRWPLLNNSLHVYSDNLTSSLKRAKLQGYAGARWPKCTGPDGREWPDVTHAFLVWQQPHPIFFAELDYRAHPTLETLKKWDRIVEQTGDFLASYAFLDTRRNEYVLGPPIKTVPENNDALTAQDPAFELAYWRFGLQTAQQWRKKLKLCPNPKWDGVLKQLAPLPMKDSLYQQWENIDSMWTKYNYEHPAMTGVFGMLPGYGTDPKIMEKTYQKVKSVWQFDKCWGWDFPMVAMCAARLGHPKDAVDMLLHPSKRFAFDDYGFVGGGNPYPYIPSNGGLLYAVAMMTAGWDGDNNIPEPGWPKNGSWVVKWEDLKKAP
ncbi:hypothetical protein [Mucilaginibacter sp. FT3.2]|uniref:hypothetical protein n=1 Tax=Mucilaginibacter sp. FT3.2 TaxID=2723090 RepID=UPI0016173EA3|nr:hypothetical protein [Mucilaginibacter sp. FT3.2]MBB6234917.1 hypothetical protein [Mucilaginibacter sp. FT3.2]